MGTPAATLPVRAVLDAFGASGEPISLQGGQGTAVRAGHLVLKPVGDATEIEWSARTLEGIAADGFRLARQVRAVDGRWVVEGWAATEHVEGRQEPGGRLAEKLAVARRLHAATQNLRRPAFLGNRTDLWNTADRAVWGEAPAPAVVTSQPLWRSLTARLRPLPDARPQVVHGDLDGNVLFADGDVPAVIDFTPYWRPALWSEAVLIGDTVTWSDARQALDARATLGEDADQYLLRGLLFRLAAHLLRTEGGFTSLPRFEAAARQLWPAWL
jgi:uncharacterized protein (TIGR02569 family)